MSPYVGWSIKIVCVLQQQFLTLLYDGKSCPTLGVQFRVVSLCWCALPHPAHDLPAHVGAGGGNVQRLDRMKRRRELLPSPFFPLFDPYVKEKTTVLSQSEFR